jgi:hypothetical protein
MFRFTQNHHQGVTASAGTRHVILAKHWLWLPDDGFM